MSVRVGATRTVGVGVTYAGLLAKQAGQAGPGYLFCPGRADRSYYNVVNNVCYRLRRARQLPGFVWAGPGPVSFATTWRPGRPSGNCFI